MPKTVVFYKNFLLISFYFSGRHLCVDPGAPGRPALRLSGGHLLPGVLWALPRLQTGSGAAGRHPGEVHRKEDRRGSEG